MSDKITKDAWKPKISAELLEVMTGKSDTDLIPIWLWLKSVPQEVISNALIYEKGMDPLIYEEKARFEREILAPIIKRLEEELGYEEAHRKGENGMSPVDLAYHGKVDEYIKAKIEIVFREYSTVNDKLVAENIGEKPRKVFYNSRSTPSIIVEATKSEIENYAKQKIVVDISLYVELIQVPCLNLSLTQIGADSTTGTKSPYFNSGYGWKGMNSVVGIMEAARGQYDPNAPQLSNIHNTPWLRMLDASGTEISTPTNITDHATIVTSIIVGQSVTVSSRTYEGVVPQAKVYQMPIYNSNDVLNGIDILAAKGCRVINYSAGANTSTGYTTFDRDVDKKISNLGVTFVVASGNQVPLDPNNPNDPANPDNYVMSPGKAFNAITVGNADTKSNPTTVRTSPYQIYTATRGSSSYIQTPANPNKPDISAPGTNISIVLTAGNVHSSSGTSVAAPLVTGIIAQIQQKDPSTKYYTPLGKAMLLLGADYSKIRTSTSSPSDIDNTGANDSNYLWKKSGTGLVSATNSINYASSGYTANIRRLSPPYSPSLIGYVSAGQKIRVVMVMEKLNDRVVAILSDLDDIDVHITNSAGTDVAKAQSSIQNVEIIEYTVTTSGNYYFTHPAYTIIDTSVGVEISIQYRIY
ncbi:MAG: S8 family peptidase [Dehalococcoidia bacterium]|nr:S8 family peptidase [Dehalococcoidia bacterium]